MTLSRSLALLLPLALLAGCNKADKNDQRSASGEVLQGTTSDAMLPLDKLKSQGPMLAPSEEKSTPEGVADEGSSATDESSADSAASEDVQPAPSPAPSSTP